MAANKPKKAREINTEKVSGYDVCQTPPHALEPLLPYLKKHWWIWESAAGPFDEMILATTLRSKGFSVTATDLQYSPTFNYFTYEPDFIYDIEITNMPFSLKYEWLARAFERKHRFALLAPYETTFAGKWQTLFKKYNGNPWFIEILSPERRIAFKMPDMGWGKMVWDEKKQKDVWRDSSAQMPTCWITWGLEVGETQRSYSDFLRTYYVPMRNVKYNDDNTEKI